MKNDTEELCTSWGTVPIISLPLMPDDEWQRLARENAVGNYRRLNGREPETVEEALEWQRAFINSLDSCRA